MLCVDKISPQTTDYLQSVFKGYASTYSILHVLVYSTCVHVYVCIYHLSMSTTKGYELFIPNGEGTSKTYTLILMDVQYRNGYTRVQAFTHAQTHTYTLYMYTRTVEPLYTQGYLWNEDIRTLTTYGPSYIEMCTKMIPELRTPPLNQDRHLKPSQVCPE